MIRTLILGCSAALLLSAAATPASAAAACRDAKGKFIKCKVVAPVRCKTAKGQFAKCGTPGARPA